MRWLRSIRLNWGLRPQTPGIYRLRARMAYCGGGRSRLLPFRLLSRRSGCVPALPYPPLRYFQSGSHQPRRAMIFHRAATNPLNFLSHWRGSPQRSPTHSLPMIYSLVGRSGWLPARLSSPNGNARRPAASIDCFSPRWNTATIGSSSAAPRWMRWESGFSTPIAPLASLTRSRLSSVARSPSVMEANSKR